jgi:hypothetical protein
MKREMRGAGREGEAGVERGGLRRWCVMAISVKLKA